MQNGSKGGALRVGLSQQHKIAATMALWNGESEPRSVEKQDGHSNGPWRAYLWVQRSERA